MENKINIAEILKNCEKGMELDCILFKDTPAYFHGVITETNYPIEIKVEYPSKELETFFLNKYGAIYDRPTAKCVIFPKGKTTWEGFVPPCKFKTGDVLFVDCSDDEDRSYQYIFILNDPEFYGKWQSYCHLDGVGCFQSKETYLTDEEYHPRFATEEEKEKLFRAIKANGYKWNEETKTLEKLVKSKFKVGDRVRNKNYKDYIYDIHDITDKGYRAKEINADSPIIILFGSQEDNYELVPNKFDINTLVPFESRVLVRSSMDGLWKPAEFGFRNGYNDNAFYIVGGSCWKQCIPYLNNEHLCGTTDDCDEYFKNW